MIRRTKAACAGLAALALGVTAHAWATPQAVTPDTLTLVSGPGQSAVDKLRQLSIDELANLQVISVEKRPESLSKAPAAIYVITHDDIIRSGAVTVPEMLRLAPNLQVYQQSAGSWVVTARGFSGNPAAQAFSNLMLVLIDGRSVYNPVFTGVYWDMLDVQADDVDRIEVISGPAGTLWGANAVQGVINIVTRKASETQGGLADVVWGTQTRAVTAQFGGKVRDDLAFRLWARDLTLYDTRTVTGTRAYDSIHRPSGGFRADWDPGSADSVSLRGDYAEGSGEIQGYPSVLTSSRDINGRWNHVWGAGIFSLLAYFDRETQTSGPGGSPFLIDTYDIEAQQTATIASWNHLVFGAGFRRYAYSIGDTVLVWTPRAGDLDVIDGFVQDDITLRRNVRLTLGLKLEDDPHSGLSPMPNVRLSWDIRPDAMAWASASRAIRAPAPFDTDIAEVSGGQTLLRGNPHFQSEVVTAYELGGRLTPSTRLSVSASGYFNVYDDLRNIQLAPGGFFPLQWGNGIAGHTAGFDVWADWRVTDWWRLTPSFDLLRENLHFKPGASPILGLRQDGLDPQQQAQLRSSMELGHGLTLDTALRYVDALPGGVGVPAYVELDSRLGWRISRKLEISVAGSNLLHDRHQELPGASEIPRAVRVELRAGF